MTPDTAALRAMADEAAAFRDLTPNWHRFRPEAGSVLVDPDTVRALCDAADEVERLRCGHCGKVECDWIGDIRKPRAEAAEAAVVVARAEVGRLSAERAALEARVREALVSLATVTDDEYATVVARHVESLLTLDLQTSGGEVQPEACPTVSGASPSEPDDPHGACSRNLVAVAVERDKALGRASRAADIGERIAQAIDQAWAEAHDRQARRIQPRTAYSVAYGDGYLDGLEYAEGIARTTLARPTTPEDTP